MSRTLPAAAGSLRGERLPGERVGIPFVMASAIIWSFGGTIARFLTTDDSWTIVFLRSIWAAAFLILFLLWRDGRKIILLFKTMGYPGIAVALCFATASATFIVALQHTTVANILLIQASTPLIAALIGRLVFKERVAPATWAAIAAVILGVTVMVSGSLSGKVSPIGDMLAVLIALMFATATVVTRRYAGVRMTPACCLGCLIDAAVSLPPLAGSLAVSTTDMALLFTFGALNLGLGMAFFVTGVRLLPAPIAALIGTLEPVLAPIWVWLVHSEVPSQRTMIGGAIVVLALVSHFLWESVTARQ